MDEETNIPVIVFYYTFPRVGCDSERQHVISPKDVDYEYDKRFLDKRGERMSAIMERVGIGPLKLQQRMPPLFERGSTFVQPVGPGAAVSVQNQHFQQYQLQQQFSQQNMRQWPGKYGQNVIPGPPLPSDLGNYDHITRKTEEWGLRGSENDIALSLT